MAVAGAGCDATGSLTTEAPSPRSDAARGGGADAGGGGALSDTLAGADDGAEPDAAASPIPNPPPNPPPYPGVCPGIVEGLNAIQVGEGFRQFDAIFPPGGTEGAGLALLWHGFGDSTTNFLAYMGSVAASEVHDLVVLAPRPEFSPAPAFGMPKTWGLLGTPEPDLALFDALVHCAHGKLGVDLGRVSTMGFSAGALWSSLLVIERSEHLASAVLWSGGTGAGGLVTVDYRTPDHTTPVLSAWGGPADTYLSPPLGVDFEVASLDLQDRLEGDGHVVVRCDHGGAHTIPFDGSKWAWEFLAGHHHGEPSPYAGHDGDGFPPYCTFPAGDDGDTL